MLFEELQKESNGAYSDFMTIKNAKEIGLIPVSYHNVIKDVCECGSENIINKALTRPQCCNHKCYIKQSYYLQEMFNRFGCKGIGHSICFSLIKNLKNDLPYSSHVGILDLNETNIPKGILGEKDTEKVLKAIMDIKKKTITYLDMVSSLGMPELDKSVYTLLKDINSTKELIYTIKYLGGSVSLFYQSRGCYDKIKCYCLWKSIPDIALAEKILSNTLRRIGKKNLDICITGRLHMDNKRMNKKEFVEYCNSIAKAKDGTQVLEIKQTSAYQTVKFIVADVETTNAHYIIGKQRGVLCTSNDLINFIQEEVIKWERENII